MTSLIERPTGGISSLDLPKASTHRSKLLDLLPAVYAGDEFMARFLCIFEDTFKPLQHFADNMHYYFNPLMTSPDLIPWLATWVDLVLDESWSLEQRRELIHSAVDLYSRRGTRGGLTEYLELYTGITPEITEYVDGMVLGPETFLGENTTIAGRERHSFTVTLRLPKGLSEEEMASKESMIRRIIETEKPAHTAYRLSLVTNGNGNGKEPKSAKQRRAHKNGSGGSGPTTPSGTLTKDGKNGKTSPTESGKGPTSGRDEATGD